MKIGIAHKTVAEVRSFTTQDVKLNPKVYITDSGKEGEFVYDSTDTSSADNLGTVLVSGSARYKRVFKGDVYASWFINESDTTGTSGNRERNAISAATTFALAQTVCPTVVLDNKRTWYVNSNAIYLDVATGKKITIKGEGNPIIDFTCTGANEDGTSAVFRTSNNWSYPITAYNTANGTPIFIGSITNDILTISAVTSGSIKKGMRIYDATNSNIMPSTKITEFLTGTGGTGTYKINKTQTFSSGTITGQAAFLAWNNRTINTGEIEINGITFNGSRNPANNGSNTVYSRPILLRQSEKVEISNCEFKNIPGSALAVGISDGITIKNNKFSSVFARNDWDNVGDAITIYAFCKNINVSDNKIELFTNQSGRCGISIDDFSKNGKVVNNEITGYERAIHIETSKNIVTANNTTERSPVGILSGGNEYCIIENNSINGEDVVFPATLAATANLFVYYDLDCSYNNNIVVGTVTTQNSLYNSKFWGDKLSIRNNVFKNLKIVNDFTNSTTSTTSNTIGTGSKTFTYTANPNLVWKLNQRLRIKNSTYVFVEGYITAVSSTSVTITVDLNGGSGTYTSWTLEYASSGGVWGYGYNNDNVYEGNSFEYTNLQVDSNNNTVEKGNIFKSSAVTYSGESATRGIDGKIIENTFIPNTGEIFSQGITVYNAVKPYVADNVLENPREFVIQNTGSTGGLFENNVYIKTDVGAAGNGFFFVDSTSVNTNISRTLRPNIIRDKVTSETYYVGNSGANYLPTRVDLQTGVTSTTISPNNDLYVGYVLTALSSSLTINAPTGTWLNGQKYSFRITDNGVPRAISWSSAYRGVGNSLPTTTTTFTPLYLEAEYNLSDTKWDIKLPSTGSSVLEEEILSSSYTNDNAGFQSFATACEGRIGIINNTFTLSTTINMPGNAIIRQRPGILISNSAAIGFKWNRKKQFVGEGLNWRSTNVTAGSRIIEIDGLWNASFNNCTFDIDGNSNVDIFNLLPGDNGTDKWGTYYIVCNNMKTAGGRYVFNMTGSSFGSEYITNIWANDCWSTSGVTFVNATNVINFSCKGLVLDSFSSHAFNLTGCTNFSLGLHEISISSGNVINENANCNKILITGGGANSFGPDYTSNADILGLRYNALTLQGSPTKSEYFRTELDSNYSFASSTRLRAKGGTNAWTTLLDWSEAIGTILKSGYSNFLRLQENKISMGATDQIKRFIKTVSLSSGASGDLVLFSLAGASQNVMAEISIFYRATDNSTSSIYKVLVTANSSSSSVITHDVAVNDLLVSGSSNVLVLAGFYSGTGTTVSLTFNNPAIAATADIEVKYSATSNVIIG